MNHEVVIGRFNFKDKIEKIAKKHNSVRATWQTRIEEEAVVYYVFG